MFPSAMSYCRNAESLLQKNCIRVFLLRVSITQSVALVLKQTPHPPHLTRFLVFSDTRWSSVVEDMGMRGLSSSYCNMERTWLRERHGQVEPLSTTLVNRDHSRSSSRPWQCLTTRYCLGFSSATRLNVLQPKCGDMHCQPQKRPGVVRTTADMHGSSFGSFCCCVQQRNACVARVLLAGSS